MSSEDILRDGDPAFDRFTEVVTGLVKKKSFGQPETAGGTSEEQQALGAYLALGNELKEAADSMIAVIEPGGDEALAAAGTLAEILGEFEPVDL